MAKKKSGTTASWQWVEKGCLWLVFLAVVAVAVGVAYLSGRLV